MNPGDLLSTKFERKMGGYKAADVDNFLVEAAALYSQQTRENTELKRKLEAAYQKMQDFERDKDSLREALLNAQRLADSIVRDARTKAEKIEQEAESRANSLILEMRSEILAEQNKLSETKRKVGEFRSQLMSVYRAHLELISELPIYHEEATEDDEVAAETQLSEEQPIEEMGKQPTAYEEAAAAELETAERSETETVLETAEEANNDEDIPEEAAADETAEKSEASAEDSLFRVRLNVRFDETTGEYIPTRADETKYKPYGIDD